MATNGVKYDGRTVRMGEKDLIIPPLTFRQLKDADIRSKMKLMGSITGNPSDEQLDAARDVVMACVRRNYADISEETIDDMLNMGNLKECLRAILGAETTPGEGAAATQQAQPTGTTSMPS